MEESQIPNPYMMKQSWLARSQSCRSPPSPLQVHPTVTGPLSPLLLAQVEDLITALALLLLPLTGLRKYDPDVRKPSQTAIRAINKKLDDPQPYAAAEGTRAMSP